MPPLRKNNPSPTVDADADNVDATIERQKHQRHSLLVAAQFQVDDTWHACAIMNVSEGGARIRMEDPCPVMGQAAIQIPTHGRVPVDIIWQEGDFVGLRFAGDRDAIDAFIGGVDLATSSPMELRRHQRCSVLWSSRIFSGGQLIDAIVLNISASGAKGKLLGAGILGERVTLSNDRFGDLPARLVWRREAEFGVEFLDPPEHVARLLAEVLPRIRAGATDGSSDE